MIQMLNAMAGTTLLLVNMSNLEMVTHCHATGWSWSWHNGGIGPAPSNAANHTAQCTTECAL